MRLSTRIVCTALIFAVAVLLAGSADAQLIGSITDVETAVGSTGKVDWTTGVVTAVGIGAPPANAACM